MAENSPSLTAVIGGITLATAVVGLITALITLRGSDHGSGTTATSAVASSAAAPSGSSSVVANRTPVPSAVSQSAAPPVTSDPTVAGVPKQGVPNQQVTMHGSGFPRGDTLKVTFATGPGEDFPLSFPPPQQVDSQGTFTFTFTIDSMFCGYNGQVNTYDFGGDGHLLTSSPLAVVC